MSAGRASAGDALSRAADLLDPPKTGALRYYDDPDGFVVDCIANPEGATDYQRAILAALPQSKRGIGVGSGTVKRLRETSDQHIVAFIASERCDRRDRSGELGYANARAAAWWNLREMLDPDLGEPIALPDDDVLIGDLTAPRWRMQSGGKILIEAKDDIRKRLGRSTDDGDAVVMAFWPEGGVSVANFAANPDASFFATGSAPRASRWAIS